MPSRQSASSSNSSSVLGAKRSPGSASRIGKAYRHPSSSHASSSPSRHSATHVTGEKGKPARSKAHDRLAAAPLPAEYTLAEVNKLLELPVLTLRIAAPPAVLDLVVRARYSKRGAAFVKPAGVVAAGKLLIRDWVTGEMRGRRLTDDLIGIMSERERVRHFRKFSLRYVVDEEKAEEEGTSSDEDEGLSSDEDGDEDDDEEMEEEGDTDEELKEVEVEDEDKNEEMKEQVVADGEMEDDDEVDLIQLPPILS